MSQFESIDRVLKKGRLELQEAKKFGPPPEDDGNENVKTENETKRNRKIEKKYVKNPNNNQPPKNEPPKPEDKLTKHQKLRQQTERGRKKYNLKPDSRGIYKPTKSSVLGSIETNIKKSSTPPKVKAKMTPAQLLKFNKQQRRSQKYSGNENNKRVQKILQRVAKNQKIDKSKEGLVQRQKDLAYGKNPYKKVFGSTNFNLQKKYDDQMLKYGGKDSKLMTQKQIDKLKKTIAAKELKNPAKTMTYLAPAGSGKPVPLKTRIKKIPKPEIEKIIPNPKVTTSTYNYVAPPPKAKQLTKLSKHLLKNKNKYVAATGLALAGGAYLLGNRRLKKTKEKEKKALIIANQKKAQKPKELVSVNLFLNKTGTPPGKTKTSSPSYAKPTQKSSNVNRNKFLP